MLLKTKGPKAFWGGCLGAGVFVFVAEWRDGRRFRLFGFGLGFGQGFGSFDHFGAGGVAAILETVVGLVHVQGAVGLGELGGLLFRDIDDGAGFDGFSAQIDLKDD